MEGKEKIQKLLKLDWDIIKNYTFYIFINSLSILIPVIVSPILINNYGIEFYGVLMLSQTIMLFFSLLLDNGFRLYFIRQISQNVDHKLIISSTYSEYMNIKFYLSILGIIIINFYILFFIKSQYQQICFFSEVIFIGNIISPTFLLMGKEEFVTISIFNGISRLLYIFFFIFILYDRTHIYLNNLFFGLGYLLTSISMIFFIYKKYGYKIYLKKITINLGKITPLLLNNTFQNFEIYIHNFLIGFLASKTELGIFSAIEKFYSIFKQALITLIEILYPSVCNQISKKNTKLKNLRGLIYLVFLFLSIIYTLIFIYKKDISKYLTKEDGIMQESLLIIFMLLPFIILIFNFKSHLELMALRLDIKLTKITFIILVLKIIFIFILYKNFGVIGIVYSLILTEILSGSLKQYFVNKHFRILNE